MVPASAATDMGTNPDRSYMPARADDPSLTATEHPLQGEAAPRTGAVPERDASSVRVTLLGVAQDGGRPQAGCRGDCCAAALTDPRLAASPVALGVRTAAGEAHLIDASRSLATHLAVWREADPAVAGSASLPTDLWLTHAHLGHVDGLGLFGPEVIAADHLPVHCSPAVTALFDSNQFWRALVDAGHLTPTAWSRETPHPVIRPIPVPHRADAADTHAFIIRGAERSLLHLPDHDGWADTLAAHAASTARDWFRTLDIDIALIDGTFWSDSELTGRDQSEVPHPTVKESLGRLGEKRSGDPRVVFIHLNHTNPLHDADSAESRRVRNAGWEVGVEGMTFDL